MLALVAGEAGWNNVTNTVCSSPSQRDFVITGDILRSKFNSTIDATPFIMAQDAFPFGDCMCSYGISSLSANMGLFQFPCFFVLFVRFSKFFSEMFFPFFIMTSRISPTFFNFLFWRQRNLLGFNRLWNFGEFLGARCPALLRALFISLGIPCFSHFTFVPTFLLLCPQFLYMGARTQFSAICIKFISMFFYPSNGVLNHTLGMLLSIFPRNLSAAWSAIIISFGKFSERFLDVAFGAGLCFHAQEYI